jgi:hypothetical protein
VQQAQRDVQDFKTRFEGVSCQARDLNSGQSTMVNASTKMQELLSKLNDTMTKLHGPVASDGSCNAVVVNAVNAALTSAQYAMASVRSSDEAATVREKIRGAIEQAQKVKTDYPNTVCTASSNGSNISLNVNTKMDDVISALNRLVPGNTAAPASETSETFEATEASELMAI